LLVLMEVTWCVWRGIQARLFGEGPCLQGQKQA